MREYRGTCPKPYRSPLADWQNSQRVVYVVHDTSDGDAAVSKHRNKVIADRAAQVSPAYQVREYAIIPRGYSHG